MSAGLAVSVGTGLFGFIVFIVQIVGFGVGVGRLVLGVLLSLICYKPFEAFDFDMSRSLAMEAEWLSFAFSRGLIGSVCLGTRFVLDLLLDQF